MQRRPTARFLGVALATATIAVACSGGGAETTTTAPATTATTSTTAAQDQADTTATTTTPAETTPTQPADGEPIILQTSDGLTLEARRFGNGSEFVVLGHMRPASMESWFPFAQFLADLGYSAIAFNFRGYGASEGSGFDVAVDQTAAVDHALTLGADRVFVIGASMGGTGAVAAAAERDAAATVTLSAPAQFEGTDAVAAAAQLSAPVLLVAAEGDAPYPEHAQLIADNASADSEVVILSGSRHGTDLFIDHNETLTQLILEFLASV